MKNYWLLGLFLTNCKYPSFFLVLKGVSYENKAITFHLNEIAIPNFSTNIKFILLF